MFCVVLLPTSYELDGQLSILVRGKTASRPALRPTQPPIQWVTISPEVKRTGCKTDHSLHLVPRSIILKLVSTPAYVFITLCLIN
jgi:hypothetical protein